MSKLRRASIHITGIVQGVGFRPFIYGLAKRYQLMGWVRNTSAGVDIEADGTPEVLDEFFNSLKKELPPLARIDTMDREFGQPGGYSGFNIIQSEAIEGDFQPISPDVSICPDCLRELLDPTNRRYHYPFINCTNCGPRFTIITDIPYDRPNTTMSGFEMCPDCAAEYQNPLDRRFHAQPIACPICGPKVWWEISGQEDENRHHMQGEDAMRAARQSLTDGKILAIKGLGGFHLSCDATNVRAVDELRRRKLRVDKPFALMMPDLATIEQYCIVTPSERKLLESRQRPIVLLERKPNSPIDKSVAPGQHQLGVMLPYTPLHYLLFTGENVHSIPLVMTSGNLSEEPIAAENNDARRRLSGLADGFLMHDRDIRTRCDDSVIKEFEKQIYFIRRSRGYAPDPIQLPVSVPPILTVGPELKNTFCLTRERYAFLSHHIGDMENYETLQSFEEGIKHFERLFRIHPEALGYDKHPGYLSTKYAINRAKLENLTIFGIQHHHAHIASCMVDNGLTGDHPLIGVAFDGTGYGDDGAIWGGEFLVGDYAGYKRLYHLGYFPLPGGDAAIKHPARIALALLWSSGLDWDDLLPSYQCFNNEKRQALRVQLESGLNTVQTSSLGRLFDGVAALAGVRQDVNYEAQAAIEFESALDEEESQSYQFEIRNTDLDPKPVLTSLLVDIKKGVSVPRLSARFHNGIAEMVREVCGQIRRETSLNEIALSGGVWQNMALLKRTVTKLRADGFLVFVHHQVPTNDGGISLGQAIVTATRLDRESNTETPLR
jgi:hydrogenase maturation protein HypF